MDGAPPGLVARAAEASTDAVLVTDADGVVLEVNHAACDLLDRDRTSLEGLSMADLVGRAARERWPRHLRRMREGAPGTENSVPTARRSARWPAGGRWTSRAAPACSGTA